MVLQHLFVEHGFVVEAGDIHLVGQLVGNGVAPIIESGSRGPGGIFLVEEIDQAFGVLPTVLGTLLGDFVADAPHDDAGMVAVAPHHVADIALRPLVEIFAVAVGDFGDAPHVEGFVHDDQPEPVAEFQQFRRWRVVAGANGVDAGG